MHAVFIAIISEGMPNAYVIVKRAITQNRTVMNNKFNWMALLSCLLVHPLSAIDYSDKIAALSLPEGFTLTLVSDQVPGARQMALSPEGILYVGTRKAGKVYAVLPSTPDKHPEVVVIAEDLTSPSGLVWLNGNLYVGAVDRILKYSDIDQQHKAAPKAEVISQRLPDKAYHGWKSLSVGPDGYLYVPVGVPCNICVSENPVFGTIQRMHPDTGEMSTYAKGVRNSVGLAWHPESGNLWFSDNGRDMLGDDVPPDEINEIALKNAHYGYPFYHAGDIADPEFSEGKKPGDYVPPIHTIQAHSAALGISFYTGNQFPDRYRNALFIAEHGSWNRTEKVGYRVSVIRWEAGKRIYEPFVSGWLVGEENWGRPNDVLVTPNGDLLISDDQAGAIYRISYTK